MTEIGNKVHLRHVQVDGRTYLCSTEIDVAVGDTVKFKASQFMRWAGYEPSSYGCVTALTYAEDQIVYGEVTKIVARPERHPTYGQ